MVYDPDAKALVCPRCGNRQTKMPRGGEESGNTCPNCGAQFEGTEKKLVYQCPYCGSWMTIDQNLKKPDAPKKITPFVFGKKEAREKILGAFDNIPFLPDSFLREPDGKDIEALYAPFWLYYAEAKGTYDYRGEKQSSHTRGNKTITEHDVYDIHRALELKYDEIPVDAMDSLDDKTIDAAVPFDDDLEQNMDIVYLAGTNAYLPDRDAADETYQRRAGAWAKESMEDLEADLVVGYESLKLKNAERKVEPDPARSTCALAPVYRYQYKGFGTHRIYMNGTTGRMSGDAPCDRGKVIIHYFAEAACVMISAAAIVGTIGVLL